MPNRPRVARPTIYDVARLAGVSKSLVSLVLNDSDLVSEAKRAAVRAAIEELGYRPSRAAITLAADRTSTVGLVIDDFHNPWFVELLEGLRAALGPRGFHIAVREQGGGSGRSDSAIDGFLDLQVDALVVAAEPGRDLQTLPIPTVLQGTRLHTVAGADQVISDQRLGVGSVMKHLASLGHTKIGHVTGLGGSARGRMEAYRDEMQLIGEPPRIAGELNETNDEGGYHGTTQLLARFPEVTAVFAANDTMALGARAALREVGREVPHDVALVGYDNSLLARNRFLDLTTVDQHGYDAGVAAGDLIAQRLADPSAAPRRVVIPSSLVVRSSSSRAAV